MTARSLPMSTRLLLSGLLSLAMAGCGLFGPPPPVLLLVTVDTLRADHLGAYGDRRGLTPHLDRLAAESVVFESAYAPASFTLPSLSALLTSRYPEEVGIAGNSAVLSKDALTLAAWLRARGWRTGAVVSNYVLRPPSGFGAGFDSYDATFPQRELVRPVPERVAPDTTAAALRQLDGLRGGGKPVFLWVHYQDPHGPYAPSPERRARYLEHERAAPGGQRELPASQGQSGMGAIPRYQFLEGHHDPAFYRAGYAGEVSLVDEAIGGLLEGVTARGLMPRASLVFAADHGESLGEDDYWFSHGELLSEPLVHVPLFLRLPGRAPSRRAEMASLLDVFPTLAAHVGGPAPAGLRGRDLLLAGAATRPSEVYMTTLAVSKVPRFGLIARGFKYLVSMDATGPAERMLRLGDDSLDLSVDQPEVLRSLRAGLAAARTGLRRVGTSEQVLSPEEREGFKALGYLEGR